MSESDPVLTLLDDLLDLLGGSVATSIEVSADSFSVAVARDGAGLPAAAASPRATPAQLAAPRIQKVHAPAVGIYSATRVRAVGERIARGDSLGAVQTLGHMAEITSPADGAVTEVLVSAGVPVEYGQPLFSISVD